MNIYIWHMRLWNLLLTSAFIFSAGFVFGCLWKTGAIRPRLPENAKVKIVRYQYGFSLPTLLLILAGLTAYLWFARDLIVNAP